MHRPGSYFERFHGHFFERGDLKYVILELLDEHPAHGYEVIRALEERFAGMYTPSAGAVYPTLQMLEEMGYLTSEQRDGKRVYSITEEGKAFLKEQEEVVDGIRKRMGSRHDPRVRDEVREMAREMRDFGRMLFEYPRRARRAADPDTLRRIREVLSRARREVEVILASSVDSR